MIDLKAAVIADLHMRPKDLAVKRAALLEAVRQANEAGASPLILAGDIMDSPSIGGREASVGSVEGVILEAIEAFDGHVIALTGNHDLPGPAQGDALTFLQGRPNVTVVNKFTVMKFEGVNFGLIPWTTKAHLKTHLQKEGKADQLDTVWDQRIQNMVWQIAELPHPKVVVAHCDINGSMAQKYSLIGGAFEFTKAQLIQMDADMIFMGHIHQRQHFLGDKAQYVGALMQNNHGEEANPTGFTSFYFKEDQDPLRMDSKFHHVKSPRYWTITSTEGLDDMFIKPGDHVKVRAKISEIPPILKTLNELYGDDLHITQDPLRDDKEKVRRTEQDFAAEDDPFSLLRAYMIERGDLGADLDAAIKDDILKPLKERLEIVTDAGGLASKAGRLDRVLSIRLQNIGRHNDIFLHFESGDGLTAITGPNGSGKTYLLEAPVAASYGEFPSRPGSLLNRVTWNYLGPALIEVVMEIEGIRYVFTRRLRKTPKGGVHEAYITAQGPEDTEPRAIAGPKASDVNERATVILGDRRLFLATVFSSQQSVGDLIDAAPAERKTILAGMLGSDYLIQISEKAKIHKALGEETEHKARWALEQAETFIEENKQIPEMLTMAEKSAGTLREAEAEIRDRIKAHESGIVRVTGKIEELAEAKEKAIKIMGTISGEEFSLLTLKGEITALKTILAGEPAALKDLAKLEYLEASAVTRIRTMEHHAIIQTKCNNKQMEINEIKAEIRGKTDENASHIRGFTDRIKILQASIQEQSARAEELNEPAELAKKPIFQHDVCRKCPLLAHSLSAGKTIDELRNAVIEAERAILALKKERGDYEAASGKEITAWEEGRLKPLKDDLETLEARKASADRDLTIYAGLDDDIKELEPVRKTLENIETAKVRLNYCVERAEAVEEQLRVSLELRISLNLAVAELPAIEAQKISYMEAIKNDNVALKSATDHRTTAEGQVAVYQLKAVDIKGRVDALPGMKKAWSAMKENIDRWQYLQDAFSKDGIPQFVVDSAQPHIDSCLDRVTELFEGRFKIELATQHLTQEGEIREALDILITNDLGVVADIKEYSGGEQKLLKTLLRIAMALFQAQRRGRRHKVFFADEAFDQLDGEFSRGLQEVFRMMAADLNQVILSSHSDETIAGVDQVFSIERGPEGSRLIDG